MSSRASAGNTILSIADLKRDMPLEPRLTRGEIESTWVHLLRYPQLIQRSQDVIRSEYWHDAGRPDLAILWSAATELLAETGSLSMVRLRDRFLAMAREPISSAYVDDRAIVAIVSDPRSGGDAGLLYHAYRQVDEQELDYDYGSSLVKRFAREYAVMTPLMRLLNDETFRERVPGNMTEITTRLQAASQRIDSMGTADGIVTFDLDAAAPPMRQPVVDGLLRRGETANLIAASKAGKSWLTYSLAYSVATHSRWLGTFPCAQGRVLVLDNELHPETIDNRLHTVARAMGLAADDIRDRLDVWALRGQGVTFPDLPRRLSQIEPGRYAIIIADAWYRFLPPGVSENDNAQMMAIYNLIDSMTARLNAAWVNVHHASKGNQTEKSVTDVGAGAGSMARATDAHIVLRPHDDDNTVVMEAKLRSFPPVEPLALRWEFPCWRPDRDADTSRLRGRLNPQQQRTAAADADRRCRILAALADGNPASVTDVSTRIGESKDVCARVLRQLTATRELVAGAGKNAGGQTVATYALPAPVTHVAASSASSRQRARPTRRRRIG